MSAPGETRGWAQARYDAWRRRRRIARDPVPGRSLVVQRFAVAREQSPPPVFVIQGMAGSGKGRLMNHLRATVQRDRMWRVGGDLDVRLELGLGVRGREKALSDMRDQIEDRVRRHKVRAVVDLPRYDLINDELARWRTRRGLERADQSGAQVGVWTFGALARTIGTVVTGKPSFVAPPRRPLARLVRRAKLELMVGEEAKWAAAEIERVQEAKYVGDAEQQRIDHLERALSRAIAEDLAAAGRRRRRRLHQAVVFIAVSDLGAQPEAGTWIVELADDLAAAAAPTMVVISCRAQQVWSARLRDYDGPGRYESPSFVATPAVEIHTLGPLSDQAQRAVLSEYRVPPERWDLFIAVSRGLHSLLDRLGAWGGEALGLSRELAEVLGRLSPPPDARMVDDAWVREVYTAIAPVLDQALDERLVLHGRAAAALRTFDQRLLQHAMGEAFDSAQFDKLLETGVVDGPWPRLDLGMTEAYAVVPVQRDLWWEDASVPGRARTWHENALRHFEGVLPGKGPQARFAVEAELLYHTLALDPDAGRSALVEAFREELRHRRFKHGETLIDVARDLGPRERGWRAEVETLAGTLYLKEGAFRLAEARFREAAALAEHEGGAPESILRIRQSLASCLRLRGRLVDADRELDGLLARTPEDSIAHFQATWTASLVKKERGLLADADALARRALRQLQGLPLDAAPWREAALALNLSALPRKKAHLLRQRADIERRRGRYSAALRMIGEARTAYRDDPEPEADALLDVVHAHLLRLRGDVADAEQMAESAYDLLCGDEWPLRSQLIATRCLAQARLAGDAPERARDLFAALAEVEANDYPVSGAIGRYGLGELARLEGDAVAAESLYRAAASPVSDATHVFEHVYGKLGLIELHREEGEARHAASLLADVDGVIPGEHPLLNFWLGVIGARVHRMVERHTRLGRRPRSALRHAEQALGSLNHRDRHHPLRLTLARTEEALRSRCEPHRVVLLLP